MKQNEVIKQSAKSVRKSNRRHAPEFKQEALALASRVGVAAAAKQLDLAESQLYSWRQQIKSQLSSSEREQQVATENARLKRQLADQTEELAILKKAAAYFAKNVR
jgi:transposase